MDSVGLQVETKGTQTAKQSCHLLQILAGNELFEIRNHGKGNINHRIWLAVKEDFYFGMHLM